MQWIKTLETTAIDGSDGVALAVVDGTPIALYSVDGSYYATADTCTHGNASLSQGFLDGHLIECPLHQGLFDVRTGRAAGEPCTEDIRSFPTRVEDGVVYVGME